MKITASSSPARPVRSGVANYISWTAAAAFLCAGVFRESEQRRQVAHWRHLRLGNVSEPRGFFWVFWRPPGSLMCSGVLPGFFVWLRQQRQQQYQLPLEWHPCDNGGEEGSALSPTERVDEVNFADKYQLSIGFWGLGSFHRFPYTLWLSQTCCRRH